jgi:hypothetical protein
MFSNGCLMYATCLILEKPHGILSGLRIVMPTVRHVNLLVWTLVVLILVVLILVVLTLVVLTLVVLTLVVQLRSEISVLSVLVLVETQLELHFLSKNHPTTVSQTLIRLGKS